MNRRWWTVATWTLLIGCGGAQTQVPSPMQEPQSDAPEAREAEDEPSPESAGGEAQPSQYPRPLREQHENVRPQTRYAEPPTSESRGVGVAGNELMRALEDFTVAESVALSGQAGCEHACRALRSMVRSAERLCALAEDGSERQVCEDARRRVRDARDFVRSSCGRCVHGPDLDAD